MAHLTSLFAKHKTSPIAVAICFTVALATAPLKALLMFYLCYNPQKEVILCLKVNYENNLCLFAISIINLVKDLKLKKESIVSNQIGRSGTSIGANIREAQYAQGKAGFVSKLQIALKRSK